MSWSPWNSCPGCHIAAFRPSRSGPKQGPALSPHFIVSVARGLEMSKVQYITELYDLRVSVEPFVAPKCPLQSKGWQRLGQTQRNCGYTPQCVAVVAPISPFVAQTRVNSVGVVVPGATTQRVTGAVSSGNNRMRPLKSERLKSPPTPKGLRDWSCSEQTDLDEGTSFEGGVLSSPPPINTKS